MDNWQAEESARLHQVVLSETVMRKIEEGSDVVHLQYGGQRWRGSQILRNLAD